MKLFVLPHFESSGLGNWNEVITVFLKDSYSLKAEIFMGLLFLHAPIKGGGKEGVGQFQIESVAHVLILLFISK